MAEREESNTSVLVERIEQILTKVSSIDGKLDRHSDRLNQVDIKIALMEQKESTLEADLKEQKAKTENAKKTAIGAIITVITGITVAVAKLVLGI
jgi:chromosome segregation ATPase